MAHPTDAIVEGLAIGSTLLAGSYVAKRFVSLEAAQFRLLMDALMLVSGATMLWAPFADRPARPERRTTGLVTPGRRDRLPSRQSLNAVLSVAIAVPIRFVGIARFILKGAMMRPLATVATFSSRTGICRRSSGAQQQLFPLLPPPPRPNRGRDRGESVAAGTGPPPLVKADARCAWSFRTTCRSSNVPRTTANGDSTLAEMIEGAGNATFPVA